MPNAAAYRTGADAFRRAATAAGSAETTVWSVGEGHGVGDEFGALVDRTVAALATTVSSVGRGCDSVADECVRRSIICEQYAADVDTWQRRYNYWNAERSAWLMSLDDPERVHPNPGTSPARPIPPFPWVEL